MAERAQGKAEGRRRLALAGPGVDHQQALGDGLGRLFGILDRLAFDHLGAVTLGLVGVDFTHDVLRYYLEHDPDPAGRVSAKWMPVSEKIMLK